MDMERIYNFSEFSQIFESSANESNIIIGDSQTPYIAKRSKNIKMLANKGSKEALWLGGMGLGWLKKAVADYQVSPDVSNVVINIGTNGGFNQRDDVSGLFRELKRVFPKAKFFVVQGSWGWGGNKNVTLDKVNKYYSLFSKEGASIINPPIGSVSDPHGDLPIYSQIGKSIDGLITNSPVISTSTINTPSTRYNEDKPDSIEKFQDWLDANKPGWAWGYPGGIVNKTGGYGRLGPRTAKAWASYKKEYTRSAGSNSTTGGSGSQITKTEGTVTQKPVGDFGKFTVSSNSQAPLIFVYGGIKVGGRESGNYMYDYLKGIQNKSSLFVAKNPSVPGVESFQSVLNQAKQENLNPSKKILYLFSGGYLPGKPVLEKYGANFFDKIYLVDIWMGNSSVAEFYKNLASKYPNKIEYYYTSSGSANPSAAKEIAGKSGIAKKVETPRGQRNTHMATNLDAVESLEKYIR
jgi:hypothetical protein